LSILQATDAMPSIAELFTIGADQLVGKPIEAAELVESIGALWGEDPPAFVAPALTGRRAAA
jgi:hypothetical protein